jgi:hypothetical protein
MAEADHSRASRLLRSPHKQPGSPSVPACSGRVIKDHYFGVKIPPANLQPSYVRESQAFADELADSLGCTSQSVGGTA